MAYNSGGGFDWNRVGAPQLPSGNYGGGYGGYRGGGGGYRDQDNFQGGGGGGRGGGGRGGYYNNRGGGSGRRDQTNNREPIDPRKEAEERLKQLVVSLGDDADAKDPESNLARVISRDFMSHGGSALAAFRAAISALPHKAANYAALVGLVALNEKAAAAAGEGGAAAQAANNKLPVSVAEHLLRTAIQALDEALKAYEWWELLSLLRFISSLVSARVITTSSHLALLRLLSQPLSNPSAFADSLAYLILESLPIAAPNLFSDSPTESQQLWTALENYMGQRTSRSGGVKYFLAQPEGDALDSLWGAVMESKANGWDTSFLLSPLTMYPKLAGLEPQELPSMPAEPRHPPSEQTFPLVGAAPLWIFDDASMNVEPVVHHLPSTATYTRHYLRLTSLALLRLSTENRKPAVTAFSLLSRLTNLPPLAAWESAVETIVADVQLLPDPATGPLYQNAIMCEFLASNAKEVAPLFGRCVRRWFDRVDEESGDVGCVKRVAEYLAVHVSNFAWKWSWDRWLPALQLDSNTARRAFIRHFLSQMVRLSYWDQIREALPEPWQAALPPQPATSYRYDPQQGLDSNLCSLADQVVSSIRSRKEGWLDEVRAAIEQVRSWARENPGTAATLFPEESNQVDVEDALARDVTMQAVMLAGSKSFSHVLNALERCLPLLRELFPPHKYAGDPSAWKAMRQGLRAVWDFHSGNTQFLEMVVDKLLNYRVIDAPSVFEWVMDKAGEGMFSEFWLWNILLSTLAKVVLRVKQLSARLETARAALAKFPPKFGDSDGMDAEDDAQVKAREEVERLSNALGGAQRDEKESFGTVFKKFAGILKAVIAQGGDPEATPLWRYASGFMREVERSYAESVRSMLVTIETLAFDGGNEYGIAAVDPRIWRIWAEVKQGVIARRIV